MRLGAGVARTIDLPHLPDPPPPPHLDPAVAEALAALRHDLAGARAAVARLTQAMALPADEARHILHTLGLDPDGRPASPD